MSLIEQAFAAHRKGDLARAESLYRSLLADDSRNFDALHMLGIICAQRGNFVEAERMLSDALGINSAMPPCLHNYASVLVQLNRLDDAIEYYNKAIALAPDHAPLYSDRGNVQQILRQFDDALASFDRALAINPGFVPAYYNRGNVLFELKRYDDAIASHQRALSIAPQFAPALAGCGNAYSELRRFAEALAAYDRALALGPDLAEAWLGRANVCAALKRLDEALAAYDRALALRPALAEAWLGSGNVHFARKHYDKAFAAYDRAYRLAPDLAGLEGSRLFSKMHCCEWSNIDAERAHLLSSLRDNKPRASPFSMLAISSSPEEQFLATKSWVAQKFPPPADRPKPTLHDHGRIRIAYLSADIRDHPTSYLIAGLFEHHDRSRFETTAISFGPDDGSPIRRRVQDAVDRFIVADEMSDGEICEQIRSLEIDVLIDLMGHTADARFGVLGERAAPVQVNYLGFAGTGGDYLDFIIADKTVVPEGQAQFFSEKICRLPYCYQANDDKRAISARSFTRAEQGLPDNGFVFCCFNNNFKIAPDVFDCWMRILRAVDGSVLWLFEDNPVAAANLKREASRRGVDSLRLIFATRLPLSDHLARLRLADLFLDTLPYNAHTTASDALWTGVPVVTRIGEAFPGRVAASLLGAIEIPELIMRSEAEYEQAAVMLARDPQRLASIRQKLVEKRRSTALFDTGLFTRHIEKAYETMVARLRAGLPPDHIAIAP